MCHGFHGASPQVNEGRQALFASGDDDAADDEATTLSGLAPTREAEEFSDLDRILGMALEQRRREGGLPGGAKGNGAARKGNGVTIRVG